MYQVAGWGEGYFEIADDGRVVVRPTQSEAAIAIADVVAEARERGLQFPLVIRFQDLLRHRVQVLNEEFAAAIAEFEYPKPYRGVFPIKVNQLREVVEEIMDAGRPYHFGIEAGSKPELMAALAVHDDPESLLICNGFKDRTFIRHALSGRLLGKQVVIVVERLEEYRDVIEISEELEVQPIIGVRLRLRSKGAGRWATSGGQNAKFGLTTADLVKISDDLKRRDMADCLQLVHFHIGSQIADIQTVKRAVGEAARYYAKLVKSGHGVRYLDVGGGLGVDYMGSRSTMESSINYTLGEYARDVVYNIQQVCADEEVEPPVIVSESGRAIVAHHSVLVVEAFGSISRADECAEDIQVDEDAPQVVHEMADILESLSRKQRRENLHDAIHLREQADDMFALGLLDLRNKAKIETMFWQISARTIDLFGKSRRLPEEVRDLQTALADKVLCNFSVFQSLLDHWALDQLFPVMPIEGLTSRPERRATVVDITCDSDGKVDKFISADEPEETLALQPPQSGTSTDIGFFLVGAYQDIMGDFHNLFGRNTEVHVFLDEDEDSGYYVEEVIQGSRIEDVLAMTQWDRKYLVRSFKAQVDRAIRQDTLKPKHAMRLLKAYEEGLDGFTYLQLNGQ